MPASADLGARPSLLDIGKALEEIRTTPPAEIHRVAAYAWGSRAIASYRLCAATVTLEDCLKYFYLGEHYREAALAHAAMGEQWQPLHAEIDQAMADARTTAFDQVSQHSADDKGRPPARSRRAKTP